jgi:hypothetical protein
MLTTHPAKTRSLPRSLLAGVLLGAVLALTVEAAHVLFLGNFHVVVPGRVYRVSQPSPQRLERLIRDQHIRTVVNLRGCCPGFDWYKDECRVSTKLDICQEDLCFSAGRLPSTNEVRRLVETLDHTDYPILFHCHRGADRTGLASAIALLLTTDASYEEGRRLLGWRYGHLALGRPGNLDRFFDLYEAWLKQHRFSHTRANFRQWLLNDYCPGECWAVIEPLELPRIVPRNTPTLCRVRCRNDSLESWDFTPGMNAGVHLIFVLGDAGGAGIVVGRGGLYSEHVPPGASIDLKFVLPSLPPGRYTLMIDLVSEQHCSFFQVGSEPLNWDFEVE